MATDWPYPDWVAHRGAGKLAPENTLAAFRLGAAHGYRMFECDVKLSADGVPFLLHDATLERTTNGLGTAGDKPWDELSRLDAGGWHSRAYAGEPLPTLAGIARFCKANGYLLNIEIKPTPGTEQATGAAVADAVAALWAGEAVAPLLTSFQVAALEAAQAAQPALPRGLLLDAVPADWPQVAERLDCRVLVCRHSLWSAALARQAAALGLRMASYTVNDQAEAQRLQALGPHTVITDRVDLFAPAA